MRIILVNTRLLKNTLIIFFIGISVSRTFSQNTNKQVIGKFDIKWISQIPSDKETEGKNKSRFVDLLIGNSKVEINKPVATLGSGEDSIIILDQGNLTILLYNSKQKELNYFIDQKADSFPSLVSVCSGFNSNILFTDSRLNKVFLYDIVNKKLEQFSSQTRFQQPTGIAYSEKNKEIWVVETKSHKISVFDESGNFKMEIGGRGTDRGKFNFPTYIWIDNSGTVYIIDSLNFRVQIFNNSGELLSVFGKNGDASGYFARPKGIATDSYGNIYIVDALFHTVQIFDQDGNFLYNFGNQGHNKGQFWMPSGIFIDKENYIYVADSYNSRIQIFQVIENE